MLDGLKITVKNCLQNKTSYKHVTAVNTANTVASDTESATMCFVITESDSYCN